MSVSHLNNPSFLFVNIENIDNLFSSKGKRIKLIKGDNNPVPDYFFDLSDFNNTFSSRNTKMKQSDSSNVKKDNSELNVNNKTANTSKFNNTNNNSDYEVSSSPEQSIKPNDKLSSKFKIDVKKIETGKINLFK